MPRKTAQQSRTGGLLNGEPDAGWLDAAVALCDGAATSSGFFAAHPALRNARTIELLHEEVLRVLYADLKRAGRLARAACELARELDDSASRAAGLRALGHVCYAESRYEEAIRNYRDALEILEALGRDHDTGRTLISGLQSLIYLGRYDEAYAWAARAKEIFHRLGDHLRLARLASNVGNILYRQDRYAEALAMYQEAHATLGFLGEHRDVAAVLCNVAVCQISLSRFAEALDSYQKARDYCERHQLPLLVAGADYNIAYLHYLQGDFLRAIELYKASRLHCRTAGDPYHAALCDLDEAEIYLELNLNREAAHLAEQAQTGFEALGMAYERGKALVTHATAASRCGEPRMARLLLGQARKLLAAEKNTLWPALIDVYRAMLLERENADREAARLCRRAYRVLSACVLPGRAALAELLQSRLLLKSHQVAGAREMSARALARLEGAGTPWLRFHAHMIQGQVEEESGDEAAAFSAYQAARLEIEALRSRLWGDEHKISFLKDKLAVYESLVKLRLAGGGEPRTAAADAFGYIQQAKSRSLADLISQPARAAADRPAPEWESEIEETRRSLNAQYRHMEHLALAARTSTAAQMETLRQRIREHESRLLRLVAETPSQPCHQAPDALDPLSIEAIQATIPPEATLLEYYVVKGVLCVCVLSKSSLEIVPLGGAEEIRTRMRLLRFQMRKFRLERDHWRVAAGGLEQIADMHLQDLYADLVAPVRDRLNRSRHLIFAPHDFLHLLPFHALRGSAGYIIDEFTVSYTPSATVFALCSVRTSNFATQSLVLGLPDQLAPSIELEAQTAATMLPEARLFLGQEASAQVLRRYGPASRFIHIAAHGLFRQDNPLFSAIRLGDSHLTPLDLYRLPLAAELVTLSGCNTGRNVVVGGDELLGLMRGLLLAGAHSVMVSLWDVNDLSTAQFMKHFYGNLQSMGNKAGALQVAMREVRADHSHPYYWAPFVLAGKYISGEVSEVAAGGR